MTTKLRFSVYKAMSYGLFTSENKNLYANFEEIIEDLENWLAHVKELRYSKVQNADIEREIFPSYCNQISNTDYGKLITIWNETALTKGKMANIEMDKPPGKGKTSATVPPKNTIPGFPTYFFIPRDSNFVITILIDDGKSAIREFSHYLKNFIKIFSKFAIYANKKFDIKDITNIADEIEITGYKYKKKSEECDAKMFLKQQYQSTKWREEILKNKKDIYKIVKSGKLTHTKYTHSQNALLSALYSTVGSKKIKTLQSETHVKIEFDYVPSTDADLEAIRAKSIADSTQRTGFKFHGNSSKTIWIDETILVDTKISDNTFSTEILNTKDLIKYINLKGEELLTLTKKVKNTQD